MIWQQASCRWQLTLTGWLYCAGFNIEVYLCRFWGERLAGHRQGYDAWFCETHFCGNTVLDGPWSHGTGRTGFDTCWCALFLQLDWVQALVEKPLQSYMLKTVFTHIIFKANSLIKKKPKKQGQQSWIREKLCIHCLLKAKLGSQSHHTLTVWHDFTSHLHLKSIL